jgi:hypothetical protein
MKKLFLLSFVFCLASAFSQNDKPERPEMNIKLYVDSTHYYNEDVKPGAYFIAENVLQIYASEKVFVEVETSKFGITSMKTVKENLNPGKTLVIDFFQEAKGSRHGATKLRITNPLGKTLSYKAKTLSTKSDAWVKATVQPISAGVTQTESWNEVVVKLMLFDWELEL